MRLQSNYDVIIVGAGHNGLVAACYLRRAGLRVLVLEQNAHVGGATKSNHIFPGIDASLSIYSYLISLLPQKILSDLNLPLKLRSRAVASYTPKLINDRLHELVIRNDSNELTRQSFEQLAGGTDEYRGYLKLQSMQTELARCLWPTLLHPLKTRDQIRSSLSSPQRQAWNAFIEEPLGEAIESHLRSDLVRGLVFTDAKIGILTHPHDGSLLQNRTFLYHILGQGTGEWRVPVGGMGSLTRALLNRAKTEGATILTHTEVSKIASDGQDACVSLVQNGQTTNIEARYVLSNAAPPILDRLLGNPPEPVRPEDEGSVVKINLVLKKLPDLRSKTTSARDAFTGTFHLDEGYEAMTENVLKCQQGKLALQPAGEMYCHSLTDASILSPNLKAKGYQTLTLFGIDMPYSAFKDANSTLRQTILDRYLIGINRYTKTPIQECLASDQDGRPCIEIKTPVDLENEIHLPQGNIFHRALAWPFVESDAEAGLWGVETELPNVFICGAGARRGGCVSGIPGHNAAMKVLEAEGIRY